MAIKSICTECEMPMVDGVLKHTKECSANLFVPRVSIEMRPPGITLKFESPEEQAEWLRKLKNGSGGSIAPSKPSKENH